MNMNLAYSTEISYHSTSNRKYRSLCATGNCCLGSLNDELNTVARNLMGRLFFVKVFEQCRQKFCLINYS